jgi:D-lactate dehydrogenase
MKLALFSTKPYDIEFFEKCNKDYNHELKFFDFHLDNETISLTKNFPAICPFVNDKLDKKILKKLSENGVKLIALRSAGFNNVDIEEAEKLGLTIMRVPAYSPYSVAEHTISLILSLNRKIHKSFLRVRDGNFSLDGLLGFDLNKKTVGIIGTGKIGIIVAKILQGFGCNVIAYDIEKNQECEKMGVKYVTLDEIFSNSDIITLHAPLNKSTYHIINNDSLKKMKNGVMIINTSRGGLVDTKTVIKSLKSGKIGYLGLDVYEEEGDIFFEDLSNEVLHDDIFARLLTFPNVLITGHQAFFTKNALENIATTTLENVSSFEKGNPIKNNLVTSEYIIKK